MSSPLVSPLQSWITTYGKSYVAHALPFTNLANVVKDGALRCSEDLYRSGYEVEFEKGMYLGKRGVTKMPQLEEKELAQLEILAPEEQKELDALLVKKQQEKGLTAQETAEFKILRKKIKGEGWKHLTEEEKIFLLENDDRAKCPLRFNLERSLLHDGTTTIFDSFKRD